MVNDLDVPPLPAGDRRLALSAVSLAALCLLATAAALALEVSAHPGARPAPLDFDSWASTVPGLALALAGAVLAVRVPRHLMTWLLVGGGVICCVNGLAAAYAVRSVLSHDGDLPLTTFAVFVGARCGPIINFVVPLVLLFFPDGRLPSPRWRWPAALSLASTSLAVTVLLALPWEIFSEGEPVAAGLADVPLDPLTPPLPDAVWQAATVVTVGALAFSLVVPIAAFARRFWRSGAEHRAQLRWMLLAAVVNLLLLAAASVTRGRINSLTFALSIIVVALAVVIAVTRYRLYDVDLVLGWTLLYGGVAALVIAVDVAVFVSVGAFVAEPVASVAAAGVVAVLYAPLRVRLQRWVNRLLTGRGEPYDVVSALARRLEESSSPDEQLLEVARTVSKAFRSPYVRVELDRADGQTVVASHGDPRDGVLVLPFAYRGASIGRLALLPRSGARLSDGDQRLLADVVRQAAAAARATALTEELQRGREELVRGVAEERRRLRRDLHDGLGPALAAAALKIEAARNFAGRDPAAADDVLVQAASDLSAVLNDVRRLVHDLRPPALDQFGLVGALEQQAAQFGVGGMAVLVRATGDLSTLPAAAEVAAYRIATEALANVSRHAAASRCTIDLVTTGSALELEIDDDGCGVRAGAAIGVGLLGMRERAEELGGTCVVSCLPAGGTRVRAVIPCRTTPATDGGIAR